MLAFRISEKISKVEDFLKHQQIFSCHHGNIPRKNSMIHSSTNGLSAVVKGKVDKLKRSNAEVNDATCFDLSISRLLLSYVKPHKNVTKDTSARWIQGILSRSGTNTERFDSLSVRSASTSKAKSNAVPNDEIIKKAGWSNVKTFAKFDDKKIVKDGFAEGVLKQ